MQITSHFIAIPLKCELFSNIFMRVSKYVQKNNLEDIITFQNPDSPHVTLYYLEQNLGDEDTKDIKKYIKNFNVQDTIYISKIKYFLRDDKKYVLYFESETQIPLKICRDDLHKQYARENVLENSFDFTPHITFFRIKNYEVFERHRGDIESIIGKELIKMSKIDVNTQKISLYAVDSSFEIEKQVVI